MSKVHALASVPEDEMANFTMLCDNATQRLDVVITRAKEHIARDKSAQNDRANQRLQQSVTCKLENDALDMVKVVETKSKDILKQVDAPQGAWQFVRNAVLTKPGATLGHFRNWVKSNMNTLDCCDNNVELIINVMLQIFVVMTSVYSSQPPVALVAPEAPEALLSEEFLSILFALVPKGATDDRVTFGAHPKCSVVDEVFANAKAKKRNGVGF